MGIVYYSTPAEYLRSCTDIKARILAIDQIIASLYASAVEVAEGANITQYSLNDGQTIISATARSPQQIADSITAWEGMRNRQVQKLTGRITRLVDGKNFTGNGC